MLLRLRRWPWIVVGLAAGMALGWYWTAADPTEGVRCATVAQFELELVREPLRSRSTFIRNIIVYPSGNGSHVVSFEQLTPTADSNGWTYVPRCLITEIPYLSSTDPSGDPAETILTFLQRTANTHRYVNYHYAWWAENRFRLPVFACAGMAAGCLYVLLSSKRIVARQDDQPSPIDAPPIDRIEPARNPTPSEPPHEDEPPRHYEGKYYPVARHSITDAQE